MARISTWTGLLLPLSILVSSCASDEVLFPAYNEHFCASPAGEPVIVEKYVDREVVKEIPAASASLPWEPAVFFDSDSAQLTSAAVQTLANNVEFLNRFPMHRVSVRGFADSSASVEYNRRLSAKRTKSVLDYFLEADIEIARLSLTAHGESIALNDKQSPVANEISRRVEMILLDRHGRPALMYHNARALVE